MRGCGRAADGREGLGGGCCCCGGTVAAAAVGPVAPAQRPAEVEERGLVREEVEVVDVLGLDAVEAVEEEVRREEGGDGEEAGVVVARDVAGPEALGVEEEEAARRGGGGGRWAVVVVAGR